MEEFLEKRVIECFEDFKKNGIKKHVVDSKYFKDIFIYFNEKPNNILFPYPDYKDTKVFIGNDNIT